MNPRPVLSREILIKGYRLMLARVIVGALLGIGLHVSVYYFAPINLIFTPAYCIELAVYIWVSLVAIGLHLFSAKIFARPRGILIFRAIFGLHATAYAIALGFSCCYIMVALKMHPYAISVVATAMAGGTVAISTFAFDFLACSIFLSGLFIPLLYTSICLVDNGLGIASACTLCYIFFHSLAFSINRTERREIVQSETIARQTDALELTNAKLNSSNQMLQGTLDSIDELFLIFDKEMVCYATPTDRTAERLTLDPLRKSLVDVFRYSGEKAYGVINWYQLLISGTVDFEVVSALGPVEWLDESTRRTYRLRYAPLTEKAATAGVIMIMTDITRSLEAEKMAAAAEANARFILNVSASRGQFADFLQKTQSKLKALQTETPDFSLADLRRDLHNIKGTAGAFGLSFLVTDINRFEVLLRDFDSEQESISLVKFQAHEIEKDILDWREKEFKTLEKLRVFTPKEIVIVESFAAQVRAFCGQNEAELKSFDRTLARLQSKSIESKLVSFTPQIMKVAADLKKKVAFEVLVPMHRPYLLTSKFDSIFETMIHLFNNSVDHGLEIPEVRLGKGKKESGNIIASAEVIANGTDRFLTVIVEDDGAGLDFERIKEVAEQRGISTEGLSQFEIYQLIFGRLSTRENATLLSGQGIGLNSLAQEVIKSGGSITVSPLAIGTRFQIQIPVTDDDIWLL